MKQLNLDRKLNELLHGLVLIWLPVQSYAHRPMKTAAWRLQILEESHGVVQTSDLSRTAEAIITNNILTNIKHLSATVREIK